MITIDPKTTPKPELFKHMLSAIGPRPIALASTIDKNENPNNGGRDCGERKSWQ